MSIDILLETIDVTRRFGGLIANRDVSIRVHRGEILGDQGPTARCKSTLFNLIAGAYLPTSGSIRFDGRDITELPATRRCALGVARTYQVPRSFDSMTVLENVMVGGFVRHASSKAARLAALQVLDFTGLCAGRHPHRRTHATRAPPGGCTGAGHRAQLAAAARRSAHRASRRARRKWASS